MASAEMLKEMMQLMTSADVWADASPALMRIVYLSPIPAEELHVTGMRPVPHLLPLSVNSGRPSVSPSSEVKAISEGSAPERDRLYENGI